MIKAIHDTLIVKKSYELESKLVIIPKTAQKYSAYDGKIKYEVVSVGPDFPYDVKAGDTIEMVRHEGKKFLFDGEEYYKVKERWVLGVYKEISGMKLEELKKEYATQDNRGTAYPIYVTVQELKCVGVIADGYSVNCPYGDGVTKIEYGINYDSEPDWYDTLEEAKESLKEQFEGNEKELEKAIEDIQELNIGYAWIPVEFFLTIKGAEEYMKANKHNHGKLRTYVHWFERRNFEMRGLLEEIGFKVKE